MSIDPLLLKARLLVDGVRVAPEALAHVGGRDKEQAHHLFEYDFDVDLEGHYAHRQPAELAFDDVVVQVRLAQDAALCVRGGPDGLVLEEHGRELTPVRWLPRPDFYSRATASGRAMWQIAELVGEDCLSVSHTNACATFVNGKQCTFCNLNYTPRQYDEVLIRKRAAEVGDVAAVAFGDGVARHFTITGGILPGEREVPVLVAYLEAFREATGLDRVPGYVIMTPPADLADLERIVATGVQGIGFNLECFDPAWFRAVCPGKEERIGYHRYREALRAAVELMGVGGRVFSGFVAGIEPMHLLLEGVQELAEEGVASIPLVWSPSAGTRMQGHRSPRAEWHVELAQRAAGLMVRHLKRTPGDRHEPPRCRRCQTQCLLQDVIHRKLRLVQAAAPR